MLYLYPNPVSSSAIIESLWSSGFKYQIPDISGRELINCLVPDDNQSRFDLSFLDPGLYLFRGETGKNQYTVKVLRR